MTVRKQKGEVKKSKILLFSSRGPFDSPNSSQEGGSTKVEQLDIEGVRRMAVVNVLLNAYTCGTRENIHLPASTRFKAGKRLFERATDAAVNEVSSVMRIRGHHTIGGQG